MKYIKQYEILQDNEGIPHIKSINQYDIDKLYGTDLDSFDDFSEEMELVCEVLNIPYLEAEHLFVIAHGNTNSFKGVYLLGIGSPNEISQYDKRNIILFLALIGAMSFYTIHNHPNGILERSDGDVFFNASMKGIGGVIGIECLGNYAVTPEGFVNLETKEITLFND